MGEWKWMGGQRTLYDEYKAGKNSNEHQAEKKLRLTTDMVC